MNFVISVIRDTSFVLHVVSASYKMY